KLWLERHEKKYIKEGKHDYFVKNSAHYIIRAFTRQVFKEEDKRTTGWINFDSRQEKTFGKDFVITEKVATYPSEILTAPQSEFAQKYRSLATNDERIDYLLTKYPMPGMKVDVETIKSGPFTPSGTGRTDKVGDKHYKITLFGVDGSHAEYLIFHEFMHIYLEERGHSFQWSTDNEDIANYLFYLRNLVNDYIIEKENQKRFGNYYVGITKELRDTDLSNQFNFMAGEKGSDSMGIFILAITCKAISGLYSEMSDTLSAKVVGKVLTGGNFNDVLAEIEKMSTDMTAEDYRHSVARIHSFLAGEELKFDGNAVMVNNGPILELTNNINELMSQIAQLNIIRRQRGAGLANGEQNRFTFPDFGRPSLFSNFSSQSQWRLVGQFDTLDTARKAILSSEELICHAQVSAEPRVEQLRALVKTGSLEIGVAKKDNNWFLFKGLRGGVIIPFNECEFRLHSHPKRITKEIGRAQDKYIYPDAKEEQDAKEKRKKIEYILTDKGLCAYGAGLEKPVFASWREIIAASISISKLDGYFVDKQLKDKERHLYAENTDEKKLFTESAPEADSTNSGLSQEANRQFFEDIVKNAPTISSLVQVAGSHWQVSDKGVVKNLVFLKASYLRLEDKVIFEDSDLLVVADMPEGKNDRVAIRFYSPEGRDNFFVIFLNTDFKTYEMVNTLVHDIVKEQARGGSAFDFRPEELSNIYEKASRRAAMFMSASRGNEFIDRAYKTLNLSEASEGDRQEYVDQIEKTNTLRATVRQFVSETAKMRLEKPRQALQVRATDVIDVGQKEMAASQYSPQNTYLCRYLQSFGAADCVVCTFYHHNSRKGAMIHIDGMTNVLVSIQNLLNILDVPPGDLEIRLLGGYDVDFISRILETFTILGIKPKILELEMNASGSSKAIILDLINGETYDMIGRPVAATQDDLSVLRAQLPGPAHLIPLGLVRHVLHDEKAASSFEEKRLFAENTDEKRLLTKSAEYLGNSPVNERIDLSAIPKEGLTKEQQDEQLEKNMETLARQIAWHNTFGLNIRYILENDTQDKRAHEILKNKIIELGKIPGVNAEELLSRINTPHTGENVIEVVLRSIENVKAMQRVGDREFVVALKDDFTKEGVSIPNYTAASAIGLSIASLRIAKEKEAKPDEYNRLKDKVFRVIKSIYERYNIVTKEDGFTLDDLEFMVTGCPENKIYYAILYALPPIAKDLVERIGRYHETLHLILQAA
ncbi:MAG: hypothetical protein Q8R14_00640, partial [Candidatus Omnitrophota bacterium]|nr:hypothetical protein [Candidatus Omnitrophota bacterium]